MDKKILVTGGNGFIGSHTVVELINAGFTPIIIDTLENSDAFILERIKTITGKEISFFQGDVNNKSDLNKVYAAHPDIKGVIHFAAYKAVGESVEKPLKYYQNNIGSLVVLLDWMKEKQIHAVVFSSSCTVYGQPDENPVTEKTPQKLAESPYGYTKQVCEQILNDVSKVTDIHSILLRYFNPIGAHPSALIGELPIGVPNNLVPYITQTAAGLRKELTVFGDDYDTPDGSCQRDFIHVVDLAKAHVKAVERMLNHTSESKTEVFNVGTGIGISVLEVIKAFEKVSGQKLNYKIGNRREGDVIKIWADAKKSNEVLGWKAEMTLEDAMLHSWNWQKSLG